MSKAPSSIAALAARKAITLLVLLSLSSTTLLAAPEASVTVYNTIGGIKQEILHKIATTDLGAAILSIDSIKAWLAKLGKRQQALDRIVISPTDEDGTLTVMQGEKVVFSASGYAGDDAVGGIDFKWSAHDASGTHPAQNLIAGVFDARRPGVYTVMASTGEGQQAQITVNVYFNEGYGLQKLLQKRDSDRTDKEKQGIAAMQEKGYLVSRDISSKKLYDPDSERQIYETDRLKREAVREKQIERKQQYPDPLVVSKLTRPTPVSRLCIRWENYA